MTSPHVIELTDQNFEEEIVTAKGVAMVDFWAEWCMPCKMLAPTIEDLAKEYAGRVKVGKLDTDAARDTAMKFGISAIPTVFLFKDGKVVKKLIGLQTKKVFTEAIDELLAG
ncbi:MAG: thioredoxin [Phycisphaerae bacterium]|nr:thioredoxin [Phycisphaerae bacterium]